MATTASMSGPARPRRRRRDNTVAWAMARVLIVAGFIALGASAYVAWRPVTNPNVQECGSPLGFFVHQRDNVIVHPGAPGAPTDPRAAAELEAQPHCRDRAATEMARAGVAFGAFVALTFLGIIVGLLDDRVALWRAPRFETYLRELPTEARVRHGLEARVRDDDLAHPDLPPIEPPEVVALVVGDVLAAVGLPFVATVAAAHAAFDEVQAVPLVLAVLIGAVVILAAALTRMAVDPAGPRPAAWCRACWASAWQSGLRPLVSWFGVDVHRLRRWAVGRDEAHATVAGLQLSSLAAHAAVGLVALVWWARAARPVVDPRGPHIVLAVVVVLVVANGASRLPARWRAFAVHPSIGVLRSVEPARLGILAVGAVAQLLLRTAALAACVAAFGGGAPFVWLLLVSAIAIAVGAIGPFPNGAGVVEAVAVLGLVFVAGVPTAIAVCAALAWRVTTFWVPLLTGAWQARRVH
jgi:uncharacterized membrane protein YbhN (UPF0104 family)